MSHFSSFAVFSGRIIGALNSLVSLSTLNSDRRKLSVDAKINELSIHLMYIPASMGLRFPSAVENSVFSIAVLISDPLTIIGVRVGIGGILGNLSALIHLNFVSPLLVRNMRLHHFSSSTVISLSCTSDI